MGLVYSKINTIKLLASKNNSDYLSKFSIISQGSYVDKYSNKETIKIEASDLPEEKFGLKVFLKDINPEEHGNYSSPFNYQIKI